MSGLPVPDLVREGASTAVEAAVVRLFTDRAARAGDAFRLTGANLPDVLAVCERVDGLPLAVELAAANTRSLAVAAIAARLAERPDGLRTRGALAPARHRTLQEVIAWSHDALDPDEQRLLAYLSIFAGGFDLAAAEAVCAGPDTGFDEHEVVDVLSALVEKSMVSVEVTDEGQYRYRMLRMIRAFASRELCRGEVRTLIGARHLAHFAALTESAGDALLSGASPAWLRRLETEYANIRAALDRSLRTRDAVSTLRMAAALAQFWELHGRYAEGRRYVRDVLAICDDDTPAALRAYALAGSACLATIQGDLAGAEEACDEAAALFNRLDDAEGRTYVLVSRGLAATAAQDLDRAEQLLRTASELAVELRHGWLQQWALIFGTMLALSRVLGERPASRRPLPPRCPRCRPHTIPRASPGSASCGPPWSWRRGSRTGPRPTWRRAAGCSTRWTWCGGCRWRCSPWAARPREPVNTPVPRPCWEPPRHCGGPWAPTAGPSSPPGAARSRRRGGERWAPNGSCAPGRPEKGCPGPTRWSRPCVDDPRGRCPRRSTPWTAPGPPWGEGRVQARVRGRSWARRAKHRRKAA
ncbi:hypothetical protein AB0A94_02815 [Streptomyces sp. NPDC044984]|uniref:ATP-binding protein n=1 Tax=Streptomyces sp. NPDC044984 TaxID=3154335 RepID=UPI003401087D